MPGAQPRRGFEARVGSTARRGSYTPAGVPGVYRVPRRGRQSIVPNDPGTPTPTVEWIQPDDVELEVFTTPLRSHVAGDGDIDPDWGAHFAAIYDGTSPATVSVEAAVDGAVEVYGDVYSMDAFCRVADYMDLPCDPVSPSPPPGMTAVYESAQGFIVSAIVSGGVNPTSDGGYVVHLDDAHTGWPTVSDLAGGTVIASSPQGGSYVPFSEDFTPAGESRDVGVFVGVHALHYSATAPDPVADPFTARQTQAFTSITCTYTYRPPRYRFV